MPLSKKYRSKTNRRYRNKSYKNHTNYIQREVVLGLSHLGHLARVHIGLSHHNRADDTRAVKVEVQNIYLKVKLD